MPDNSRRILDATHQLNIELRDDLRDTKRTLVNIVAGGIVLLVMATHL